MNKNSMALCTVEGTTFPKKRSAEECGKYSGVQNAKTKRKGCMCECLYVKWISLGGIPENKAAELGFRHEGEAGFSLTTPFWMLYDVHVYQLKFSLKIKANTWRYSVLVLIFL